MKQLPEILKKDNSKKIRFRICNTQRLQIIAKVNGVKGIFSIDTGASSSCICFDNVNLFSLNAVNSNTKAHGA